MKQIAAREAIGLLRSMTRILCVVGVLAMVCTTVNVTRFATSRDVPWPIASLLDPLIGTSLAGVLYADARLAAWGISPPAWSTALRWGAGCIAALMNTWESLWPDGQIGWPRHADPAAVLLYLTPAMLLVALAETIAAYRRTVTDLLERIGSGDPSEQFPGHSTALRSGIPGTEPIVTGPDPLNDPLAPDRSDGAPPADRTSPPVPGHTGPYIPADTPPTCPPVPTSPPADDTATDGDMWVCAIALDDAARAATGKPVSVWRLRTDLHIGPKSAQTIRDQLLARHVNPPPANG